MKYKTDEEILDYIKDVEYIFVDFDGTLIFSEDLNKQSYTKLLKTYGIGDKISDEFWATKCVGHTDLEIAQFFIETYTLPISPQKVIKQNLEDRLKLYKKIKVPLIPIFDKIFKFYPNKNYWILSNNNKKLINYQLEKLGVKKYFVDILSNQETGKPKEVMLKEFIKQNKISPGQTCCIDDEPTKINNFIEIGTKTIFIQNYEKHKVNDNIMVYKNF